MDESTPIVRFENVTMAFGETVVHQDLNLEIFQGQGVTILGPSGIGKTIILKLIMGLLLPTSGKVFVCGHDMNAISEEERRKVRAGVGMLFQGAALFDSMNVYENVAFSLREFDERDESKIKATVERCLEVIGLSGIEKKFPPELSGGQKKRVGLARSLASSPQVMLLDEPTTGLDPTSTRLIDDLVIKLKQDLGITCISVTHDIESARRISERWILIHNTGIIADGDARELAQNHDLVRRFISGQWNEDLDRALERQGNIG